MFVGFTWWSSFFSVRNDAIRYKHTRPHSGPVHKNTRYFWKRRLFYTNRPCESAHRNRLFLKPLSRMDFFGSDAFDDFALMTEMGYFSSQKKDWTRSVIFKWKLSSWKWRTTMLPALIASVTACVESILLFWRQQLAIWNSLKLWNLLVRDEGM